MEGTLPVELKRGGVWAFIDWDTPWLPAMEVSRSLRQLAPDGQLSITMVLSQSQMQINRRLLETAEIDWIQSPVDAVQIVQNVERFTATGRPGVGRLTFGDLMADPGAHLVKAKGTIVPLGPSEFSLLIYFMENRGRICSRTELMGVLGKGKGDIKERTIDIWVGRLRRAIMKKLEQDILRTVRSQGYIMDCEYL